MYYSPPDSSVRGISQTRILEWVAIYFSKGTSQFKYGTRMSCISTLPLSYQVSPLRFHTMVIKHCGTCTKIDTYISGTKESLEVNQCTYGQLIYDKEARIYNLERAVFSKTGWLHGNQIRTFIHTIYKTKVKMV